MVEDAQLASIQLVPSLLFGSAHGVQPHRSAGSLSGTDGQPRHQPLEVDRLHQAHIVSRVDVRCVEVVGRAQILQRHAFNDHFPHIAGQFARIRMGQPQTTQAVLINERAVGTDQSKKFVLVIGAEVFSRILDFNDRTTCVLFGDGAGAVVLKAADTPGLLATSLHADGSQSDILNVPGQVHSGKVIGDPFLRMDGQAVFKFAVTRMADVSAEIMERNHLTADDVKWLVPHQANKRIIDATASRMGVGSEKVMLNIQKYGNTTNGTIPICLWEWENRLHKGDVLILAAFGGGFTWGSVYLRWAYDPK